MMNKGVVFLLIVLGMGLCVYGITKFNSTGFATFDLDSSYAEGQPLDGTLKMSLKEGEFIPASSKVIFENNGQRYEFLLNELVSDKSTEGTFFVAGTSISGSGEGYGPAGTEVFVPVEFTLKIVSQSEDGGSSSTSPTTESNTETTTDQISEAVSEETSAVEETESVTEEIATETSTEEKESKKERKEEKKESKEDKESESVMTGNVVSKAFKGTSYLFLRMTGRVSMDVENEVKGQVTTDNPYVYELKEGETAEIVSGDVILNIENGKAVVTTNSKERKIEASKDLNIDLSKVNLSVQEGDLKVSLVYNEEEIISLTKSLSIESNETIEVNVDSELTEEEKNVLTNEFGELTVRVTDAKKTSKGIVVRFEIGSYWIEHSYPEMSDEELKVKVEQDMALFLKDIARTLLDEEESKENVEGIVGSHSIS